MGSEMCIRDRILGSKMGTARLSVDIPALIEDYLSENLFLDSMISNTHPLDKINEALEEVRVGKVLRNVIVFNDI